MFCTFSHILSWSDLTISRDEDNLISILLHDKLKINRSRNRHFRALLLFDLAILQNSRLAPHAKRLFCILLPVASNSDVENRGAHESDSELTSSDRMTTELNWTIRGSSLPRIYVGGLLPRRKIPSASPAQTHPSSSGLLLAISQKDVRRVDSPRPPSSSIIVYTSVCGFGEISWVSWGHATLGGKFLYENYAIWLAIFKDLCVQRDSIIFPNVTEKWEISSIS